MALRHTIGSRKIIGGSGSSWEGSGLDRRGPDLVGRLGLKIVTVGLMQTKKIKGMK